VALAPRGKEHEDSDRKKSKNERKRVEEHCVFPAAGINGPEFSSTA
jgi:hypothetical protein